MKMKYRRGFLREIRKNILHKKGGVDFTQYPSFFYEPTLHSTDFMFENKVFLGTTYRIYKYRDDNKKVLYPMIVCYVNGEKQMEVVITLPQKLARQLYRKDVIWIKKMCKQFASYAKNECRVIKYAFDFNDTTE